jgi:hypothetical protein
VFVRSWLAAALVCGLIAFHPGKTSQGAEPNPNPFEGQWSLEYFVATKPGGETHQVGILTLSPINLLFQVARSEFQVGEDGKFNWTERSGGQWHSDTVSTDSLGQRSISVQDTEPLLVADGTITLVDAAMGDEKTKSLELKLKWSHGSGTFIGGVGNVTGTLAVSGDGQTLTVTSDKGAVSMPHTYLTTQWTLTPKSVEREEEGPDMIREVTTFQARRQGTLSDWGSGALPVVERIEVKQIRHLKLVPRG